MTVYVGSATPDKIFLGPTSVTKLMFGDRQVWPDGEALPITFYDYQNNFLIGHYSRPEDLPVGETQMFEHNVNGEWWSRMYITNPLTDTIKVEYRDVSLTDPVVNTLALPVIQGPFPGTSGNVPFTIVPLTTVQLGFAVYSDGSVCHNEISNSSLWA